MIHMPRVPMDFDYKKLGTALAWHRTHNNLRQIDLELKSNYRLKQPAISAAERGETRLAVDTLVEYCNAVGIRTDMVLDPFLTTPPDEEASDAIIDPYVIQIAKLLEECTPDAKIMILQIISILKENFMRIEQENQDLKAFYHKYED